MNIVITGASSGIGAELFAALSQDGHKVFGCSRRPRSGQYKCDVSNAGNVSWFVHRVADVVDHIDALLNCAAIQGDVGPAVEASWPDWWRALQINLLGSYLTIREFYSLLKQAERPSIINFAGGGAFDPFPNYSGYACSKAAVVRMTECLAIEMPEIRINALAPGFLPTPIHGATLRAGFKRAGKQYTDALEVMSGKGEARMENVIATVRMMLRPDFTDTGKTYRGQTGLPVDKERVHG